MTKKKILLFLTASFVSFSDLLMINTGPVAKWIREPAGPANMPSPGGKIDELLVCVI